MLFPVCGDIVEKRKKTPIYLLMWMGLSLVFTFVCVLYMAGGECFIHFDSWQRNSQHSYSKEIRKFMGLAYANINITLHNYSIRGHLGSRGSLMGSSVTHSTTFFSFRNISLKILITLKINPFKYFLFKYACI
jgi:hypothetical protein